MASPAFRLIAVLCDGEPSCLSLSVSAAAGAVETRFQELCALGYLDLAFDLACDALRRRRAITSCRQPRGEGIGVGTSLRHADGLAHPYS